MSSGQVSESLSIRYKLHEILWASCMFYVGCCSFFAKYLQLQC